MTVKWTPDLMMDLSRVILYLCVICKSITNSITHSIPFPSPSHTSSMDCDYPSFPEWSLLAFTNGSWYLIIQFIVVSSCGLINNSCDKRKKKTLNMKRLPKSTSGRWGRQSWHSWQSPSLNSGNGPKRNSYYNNGLVTSSEFHQQAWLTISINDLGFH